MKQYRLNMSTVISLVENADFSLPAGSVERGDYDLTLRGGVSYKTADDLKNLPLTLPSARSSTFRISPTFFKPRKSSTPSAATTANRT